MTVKIPGPGQRVQTKYDAIPWDEIAADVMLRYKILRATWQASERDHPELHTKMVNDLYFPILKVLAEFCACVDLEDDDDPALHSPEVLQ